jgi:hypothetical protein
MTAVERAAAVLAAHRPQQAAHIGAHPPPQIAPPEPSADSHEYFFQLRRPHIRPHTILHDKHNGRRTRSHELPDRTPWPADLLVGRRRPGCYEPYSAGADKSSDQVTAVIAGLHLRLLLPLDVRLRRG